jgi:dihydrofolate synthase/folylpolyglutamate synthase
MTVRAISGVQGIERWLSEAVNHERAGTFAAIKLERIRAFLDLLPAPPRPCTVAGTKGKGSTVRLMECALRAAGIPTLAFTSPHVATVLERWRIDGQPAAAEAIAPLCESVAALEERHRISLTYFERTFAVACLLAGQRPGTAFLCEVGLGGRLDCANALDCAVAVLTHLSHDHRDVLGPTLHHIAREKLAVSRPGMPLVIAPQGPAAALAIWRELGGLQGRSGAQPQACWVQRSARPWQLAMAGSHQQENAATAATALRCLMPGLDDATMRAGFASARLAARCQEIEHEGRRFIIDGAHNGPSILATVQVAQQRLRAGWRMILGLARDKEIDEVLAIVPSTLVVARCGYSSPRARGREDWPDAAVSWRWHERVQEAIAAQPAGLDLCITGSFYLAGEALALLGHAGELPG